MGRNGSATGWPLEGDRTFANFFPVGNITTGPDGKNGTYVPAVHRYFIGVPQPGSTDDQVLVYGIN